MTLEELLNKLIQMGWKPRNGGDNWFTFEIKWNRLYFEYLHLIDNNLIDWDYSLRDLVSMESWLWQFVVEKKLWKKWFMANEPICTGVNFDTNYTYHHYERWNYKYRLMLSSVQSNIELFLLDNILLPTK